MNTVILTIQVLSSILLILCIMTQNRGSGLGSTFGGTSGFYASKRGVEKILERTTIILAVFFLASSLAITIVQ